jgi:hypothetical protein
MAEDKLQFDEDVTLWAQIAATRLVKAIKRYKIGKSGALVNSITQEINNNGGDSYKAIFKFLQYGRYVDMGTGHEFARGARGSEGFNRTRNQNGSLLKMGNRQPKPWYSKTMYREIKILSEKLLANMDEQVLDRIKGGLRRVNNHSNKLSS